MKTNPLPFQVGDRVAWKPDPKQLGTVVKLVSGKTSGEHWTGGLINWDDGKSGIFLAGRSAQNLEAVKP